MGHPDGLGAPKRRSRHTRGRAQRLGMSLAGRTLSSTGRQVFKDPAGCLEANLPSLIALHIGAEHLNALAAGVL